MRLPAAALLLADARTPLGGYAHSAGLEAAVSDGLDVGGVPGFLRGRLVTVAAADAALTAAATTAAHAGDVDLLLALDDEARARCPSPVLRDAASALGRALLRTGASLFPDARTPVEYRGASSATPRPVVLGVVAAAGGLSAREAAMVSLHEDVAGVASAAVKLLPVDAAAAAGWVAALGTEIERCAMRAAACAPADLPAAGAPLIDLRSLAHHHEGAKLFAT